MSKFLPTDRYGSEMSGFLVFDEAADFPAVGIEGVGYTDTSVNPNALYRWDDVLGDYVQIGGGWIKTVVMDVSRAVSVVAMQPIPELEITLGVGRYVVEFTPRYNVNAVTTGTGWNFQGGTAVLSGYSFRSTLPSTSTANYANNYTSRSQNFTTAQTARVNDNRGTIIAEFEVTLPGTLIPHFRSEIAGNAVTLLPGSVLRVEKLS